ncbi:unnamed protein product, partial [Rotaria magnacalcarata]
QSPIESSNLRTSVSEPSRTADIIEEETTDETNFNVLKQKQASSFSATSSRTASTENLPTSSSEDEFSYINKKMNAPTKNG